PDTSHRITQHVMALNGDSPVFLPNPEARTSLICRQDAGRFIASLGMLNLTGAVNGAAPSPIALGEFYKLIAGELGKNARFTDVLEGSFQQQYGRDFDTSLNVEKAISAGILLGEVRDFLPAVVQTVKSCLIDRQVEQTPEVRARSQELRP